MTQLVGHDEYQMRCGCHLRFPPMRRCRLRPAPADPATSDRPCIPPLFRAGRRHGRCRPRQGRRELLDSGHLRILSGQHLGQRLAAEGVGAAGEVDAVLSEGQPFEAPHAQLGHVTAVHVSPQAAGGPVSVEVGLRPVAVLVGTDDQRGSDRHGEHAVLPCVGGAHLFPQGLGQGVGAHGGQGVILVERQVLRPSRQGDERAEDQQGAGHHYPAHADYRGRLQRVEGADHVGVEHDGIGVVGRGPRHVHQGVATGQDAGQLAQIVHVAEAARSLQIEGGGPVPVSLEGIDHLPADAARTAGDQHRQRL